MVRAAQPQASPDSVLRSGAYGDFQKSEWLELRRLLALAEAHRDAVRSDTLVLLDQGSKPKGRSGHGRLAADTALEGHFASVTRLKASLESTGWPLCGRDSSACVRVAGWTRARRPRGAARGGRAVLVRAGGE